MDVDLIAATGASQALGKPAQYIPRRGTVVETRVTLDIGVQTIGQFGLVVQQIDTIDIPVKDVPSPVLGSVIRLKGREWRSLDGTEWRIDSIDTLENEVIQATVVACPLL